MSHDLSWTAGAYAAEFASADDVTRALRVLMDKGYMRVETYSPVPPVNDGRRSKTRLPVIVFVFGVLGGLVSYAIQWYANAYAYPLDIGGRPAHAIPAFLIPTFEGTVLSAALAAFVGFFWIARLPKYWHPMFELHEFSRATVDRYWLAIDATDRRSGPDVTVHELRALAPLRIYRLEGADA